MTGLDPDYDFDPGEFEDEAWRSPGVLGIIGAIAAVAAILIVGGWYATFGPTGNNDAAASRWTPTPTALPASLPKADR